MPLHTWIHVLVICPILQSFRSRLTDSEADCLTANLDIHLLSVLRLPLTCLLKHYPISNFLTLNDCFGYFIYSFSYPLYVFILSCIIKKLRLPFKYLQLNHGKLMTEGKCRYRSSKSKTRLVQVIRLMKLFKKGVQILNITS